MMKKSIYFFALLVFFASCGGSSEQKPENKTDESTDAPTDAAAAITTASGLTITPFADSYEFTDAQLASYSYKDKNFQYNIISDSYKLGQQTPDAENKMCANSGKGQHVHLIVDNKPYAAKYTANFEYEIEDGKHYLLSFLSRSYHESIKTAGAFSATEITVKDNSMVNAGPIENPMLFYSRPKGTYVGKDTKKVMLDFFLVKTGIGEYGNKVKADINGEEVIFDKWVPYYIEGLPMGENKITLTLIDPSGKAVLAPYNPVTRVFNLMEEKPSAN